MSQQTIAFQGSLGANSDIACRRVYPKMKTLPCASFEDAFAAVRESRARYAMIPIDNSVAGRVADIHHLLPNSKLHIVGEHFQRVEHCLVAPKGASLDGIEEVHSHVHALGQCRKFLKAQGYKAIVHPDTAGAAHDIALKNDKSVAAIASDLAAEIYGLKILKRNIEDADHNTTRFIIMAREPVDPNPNDGPVVTSFVFRVRSVPAALYKALGGFATNGVNITKLESYMIDGRFTVAQFHADVEAHPKQTAMKHAFEELKFFSDYFAVLGVYRAADFRKRGK